MTAIRLTLSSIALITLAACTNTPSADSNLNPVIADKNYPSAFQYKNSTTQVISPYRPYNVITVKGLKPGHLARDPSTAKLDKSGKPILSTAKIFRIPELKKSPANN